MAHGEANRGPVPLAAGARTGAGEGPGLRLVGRSQGYSL